MKLSGKQENYIQVGHPDNSSWSPPGPLLVSSWSPPCPSWWEEVQLVLGVSWSAAPGAQTLCDGF